MIVVLQFAKISTQKLKVFQRYCTRQRWCIKHSSSRLIKERAQEMLISRAFCFAAPLLVWREGTKCCWPAKVAYINCSAALPRRWALQKGAEKSQVPAINNGRSGKYARLAKTARRIIEYIRLVRRQSEECNIRTMAAYKNHIDRLI